MSGVPTPCAVDGCQNDTLARVCGGCVARFESALRSIPDDPARRDRLGNPLPGLAAELEVTRTRQHRTVPDGPGVTVSPSRPLAWDERADEAAAALWACLAGWYEVLAPELPDPPACGCPRFPLADPWCWDARVRRWEIDRVLADRVLDPVTLDGLAGWLYRHRGEALAHPDAPFVVSDVLDAVVVAERAVDAPPELVAAGHCDQCGTALYGRLGRAVVTCVGRRDAPGCGETYSAAAKRTELLDALREHTATAAEIAHGVAQLAGVKIDRRKINVWATRIVDTALVPDIGPSLPARADHARPKLPDRRTPDEFAAGRERLFCIGEVLDLVTESAVARHDARTRRTAAQSAPEPDDWARRMAESEPLDATG